MNPSLLTLQLLDLIPEPGRFLVLFGLDGLIYLLSNFNDLRFLGPSFTGGRRRIRFHLGNIGLNMPNLPVDTGNKGLQSRAKGLIAFRASQPAILLEGGQLITTVGTL